MEAWGKRKVGLESGCRGAWKIGSCVSEIGFETSKSEEKWALDGQNRGLEDLETSKIGSWPPWRTLWMAQDPFALPF